MHVKKLNKDDYELLAKLILTHYVSNEFNQLQLKDRPDLQSEDLSIGIEVTRGISQQQGHTQSILIDGINNDGLAKEEIETLTAYGHVFKKRKTSPDRTHIAINSVYADLSQSIKDIKDAINNKIKKFEEYDEFSKKGIFVYSESPIIEDGEVSSILDHFDNSNYPLEYLFIFVHNNNQTLYYKNYTIAQSFKIEGLERYYNVREEYKDIKTNK